MHLAHDSTTFMDAVDPEVIQEFKTPSIVYLVFYIKILLQFSFFAS